MCSIQVLLETQTWGSQPLKDLKGDFDPDSYDAVMATAFSDDYYAMEEKEEEDEEKPVFSEEGEYQSYFSNCNLICVLMCLNIISSWLVSSLFFF